MHQDPCAMTKSTPYSKDQIPFLINSWSLVGKRSQKETPETQEIVSVAENYNKYFFPWRQRSKLKLFQLQHLLPPLNITGLSVALV